MQFNTVDIDLYLLHTWTFTYIHIREKQMEADRKLRTVTNYYRKNTLKKYFQIWKKYTCYEQSFNNKSTQKQHNNSFDSKVKYSTYFCFYLNDSYLP